MILFSLLSIAGILFDQVAYEIETKIWVKLIFIDWAIFICYTRIYLGVHYPADLIGGAIIGIATAFIVYRLYLFLEKKLYKEITFSYEN